jgi:hypothetical protein
MDTRTRERMGAATGLVSAALLVVSFVIGLSPDPPSLSAPPLPVAAYVVQNQDALQVQVFLNSLAMLFFLWFLGSVRAGLRTAEGGAGRVSAIASGGALVGVGFVLLGNLFTAAATLHPQFSTIALIHTLSDLDALSIGLGTAAFAVFFLAVAVTTLMDGGLPKILGWLALIVTALAAVGLVTVFSDQGVFAADGAFGFWARYAAFVIWVAVTSVVLISSPPAPRRRTRS